MSLLKWAAEQAAKRYTECVSVFADRKQYVTTMETGFEAAASWIGQLGLSVACFLALVVAGRQSGWIETGDIIWWRWWVLVLLGAQVGILGWVVVVQALMLNGLRRIDPLPYPEVVAIALNRPLRLHFSAALWLVLGGCIGVYILAPVGASNSDRGFWPAIWDFMTSPASGIVYLFVFCIAAGGYLIPRFFLWSVLGKSERLGGDEALKVLRGDRRDFGADVCAQYLGDGRSRMDSQSSYVIAWVTVLSSFGGVVQAFLS